MLEILAEIGRNMVQGQRGQKVHKTPSQAVAGYKAAFAKGSLVKKMCDTPISTGKSWAWWYMPAIPVMVGSAK
jgi:hypothetical protein